MKKSDPVIVTLDKRGRVYFPKEFRMLHRLMDGTTYAFKQKKGRILMIPTRPKANQKRKP